MMSELVVDVEVCQDGRGRRELVRGEEDGGSGRVWLSLKEVIEIKKNCICGVAYQWSL